MEASAPFSFMELMYELGEAHDPMDSHMGVSSDEFSRTYFK